MREITKSQCEIISWRNQARGRKEDPFHFLFFTGSLRIQAKAPTEKHHCLQSRDPMATPQQLHIAHNLRKVSNSLTLKANYLGWYLTRFIWWDNYKPLAVTEELPWTQFWGLIQFTSEEAYGNLVAWVMDAGPQENLAVSAAFLFLFQWN